MTIDVKDAGGVTRSIETPNVNGRAAATGSRPVALSSEDKASLDAIGAALGLSGRAGAAGSRPVTLASEDYAQLGRAAAPAAAVAATIPGAAAITPAIDLAAERLHRIALPAAWTAAAITFQSSADGVAFADLFDTNGEVTLSAAIAGANRSIVVDPAVFLGVRHLKVRSGTAAGPVAQAADRALMLVTVAR